MVKFQNIFSQKKGYRIFLLINEKKTLKNELIFTLKAANGKKVIRIDLVIIGK